MILRRAGLYDMPDLARLYRATVSSELPFLPVLHTPAEDRAFFCERLFAEFDVWVAQADTALLGYIAFRGGFVNHLFLDAKHLRQGVGTALLNLAKAEHAQLSLWTFQANVAARGFYERHGFRAVTFTDGADNEEKTPDVFYTWTRSDPGP